MHPGLTSFGTLAELTVDNVKLDGQTISLVGGAGLTVDAPGDTSFSNNKIIDVAIPQMAMMLQTKRM